MGFASQTAQQKFPFSYDAVYAGLLRVIPELEMAVKSEDKLLGRITASAGMSLLSWGENLVVVVEKLDEQSTLVSIDSSLKVGLNIAGAHRHHKNFEAIIAKLSKHLQALRQGG